jgi:hypothetical protein
MDDFEKFIFLWLCFVITLKAWASNNGVHTTRTDEPDDGWFVNEYFRRRHADKLVEIFEKTPTHLHLATRKCEQGDYVVQSTKSDQEYFSELYRHYKQHAPMPMGRRAQAIGRVLKAIRNNLFHGEKCYDSNDDQQLVEFATPILETYVIDAAYRDLGLRLKDAPQEDT